MTRGFAGLTKRFRAALQRSRFPIGCWFAVALVLVMIQVVSNDVLKEPNFDITEWRGLHRYLDGWIQFDGLEYRKIVEHGYWYLPGVRSPVVWFPLYPMIVRVVRFGIEDTMLAGMLVTVVAGIAAVSVYWRWLEATGMSGERRRFAFLTLLLYPYGWYLFGPVHSDALFLVLIVSACLLIERDHLVAAGLVGALATATRPTGIALIPAMIVFGLIHDGVLRVPDGAKGVVARFAIPIRVDLRRLRPRTLGPALSALGLGGYMLYLGLAFGDPIAFVNNQRVYHPGGLPLLKRAYFVAWRDATDLRFPLTLTGQLFFAVVAIISVPFVGRRFGWGYGVFVAVLVAVPTFSTEDFMGTGRYLMAAFPVAALVGERLSERRRARVVWCSISAIALLVMTFGFSRSWYLT